MDIKQLHYFIQVADSGSFSKASQTLFVSQPALSKAIKSMEEEMGFNFFYTRQRRQYLTDAGQAFYDKAVYVANEFESMINTEYEEHGIVSGHLTIGLSAAAGPALFAHISPKFSSLYPLVDISLTEKDSSLIKEKVFKRNVDAAFIDLHYLNKEEFSLFDIFKIAESEVVAVLSESNPLSSKKSLHYLDLDEKDIIFFQSDESSFGLLSNDLKAAKAHPKIIMSSSQWHLIFDLVEANYGLTVAPYYVYNKFHNSKLKAIPFDEPTSKRTIALITRKDESMSKPLKAFVDLASNKKLYEDLSCCLKANENI